MISLTTDIARLFRSKRLYLAIILGQILLLHSAFDSVQSWACYTPMQLLSIPLGISDFTPFAAILCVLPFSDSFCEDYTSGYYNNIISRVGAKKYSVNRCLSVGLGGALTMAVIMSITILFCILAAGEKESAESVIFLQNTVWGRAGLLTKYKGSAVYILRVLLAALFGAQWALLGLFISTVLTNKYTTLIIPFVAYQVLWYLLDGTAVNPVYLLRADSEFVPSLAFAILYQLCWSIILGILSVSGIKRRTKI